MSIRHCWSYGFNYNSFKTVGEKSYEKYISKYNLDQENFWDFIHSSTRPGSYLISKLLSLNLLL